jgi:hypothetical protein
MEPETKLLWEEIQQPCFDTPGVMEGNDAGRLGDNLAV